jgi:hypothetical protein
VRICNKLLATLTLGLTIPLAAAPPDSCSTPQLASPARHYSLKLNSLYTPQAPAMGLFVKARINGGPILRMLVDSGATYVVLDKRAAALSGRSAGSPFELVSFGSSPQPARIAATGTVEIGALILRECNILVVEGKLLEGIDGVLPLSLFGGFLLRLNVPGKSLELDPYPPGPPAPDDRDSPARADNCLLYLAATLNESQAGYVLLDTGATYNAVSRIAARSWKEYGIASPAIALHGGAGDTQGYLLPNGVRFRFGSRVVAADPVVVVDLSAISRHHQFEVAGILGYPALRRSTLTISYRDSLVRIEDQ